MTRKEARKADGNTVGVIAKATSAQLEHALSVWMDAVEAKLTLTRIGAPQPSGKLAVAQRREALARKNVVRAMATMMYLFSHPFLAEPPSITSVFESFMPKRAKPSKTRGRKAG